MPLYQQPGPTLPYTPHKTDLPYSTNQPNTYQPNTNSPQQPGYNGAYDQSTMYNQTDPYGTSAQDPYGIQEPYGKSNVQFNNSTSVETSYYDSTHSQSLDPYTSTSIDEYNVPYDKTTMQVDPYQYQQDAYGNQYGYADPYGNQQPPGGDVYNHEGMLNNFQSNLYKLHRMLNFPFNRDPLMIT